MRDALAEQAIPAGMLGLLLVILGLIALPHVHNLAPAVMVFFYLTVVWRYAAHRYPQLLPGRILLFVLTLLALAVVVTTIGVRDGRLVGTAMLLVLLGLKLLEVRARRDLHVALYLGYFLTLTQFLYNQSMWLALYLFIAVAGLLLVQVGLNRVNTAWFTQSRMAGLLLLGALPLALVLFVLFPRLQSPLWGIDTQRAVTGISDQMRLGDIGALSRSNATAFRVRFYGDVPEPAQRYWRGPVLWETDGRHWQAGLRTVRPIDPVGDIQAVIDYEVTLEPTGQYWLFGLDIVTSPPPGTRLNRNHALVRETRVNQRFNYRTRSDPTYRITRLSRTERHAGLQLPLQVSPRVKALVNEWQATSDRSQPFQLIEKALRYFREQPFVYTLSPGMLGDDPVDEFLFETRRGFCEHFAGSFALLMRLAGIPSRVVVGYQGGQRNPHAEHWVVRQSDAHAWTEVWLADIGWYRVDPTAAVAPERVERPINTALSEGADSIVFSDAGSGWLRSTWLNVVWLADAVDLNWHRWIVGFSSDRQNDLFEQLGLHGLMGYAWSIMLLVACALGAAFAYLLAQLPQRQRVDPVLAAWQKFLAKLQRAGLQTAAWQGPDTICAAACQAFPAATEQLGVINRLYVQLRYGRRFDRQQLLALHKRIRALRLQRG